jgi:hypothetical protein
MTVILGPERESGRPFHEGSRRVPQTALTTHGYDAVTTGGSNNQRVSGAAGRRLTALHFTQRYRTGLGLFDAEVSEVRIL